MTRHPFRTGLLTGFLVAATLWVGYLITAQTTAPGKCPEGQFPATNPSVGGRCFPNGTTLPPGWTADPGGNEGLPR